MDRYDKNTVLQCVGIFLIVILSGFNCWVVKSYFEAKAFRKLTGKPATTWDAMFLELRVQEGVKE